jgi:hypothetical protein
VLGPEKSFAVRGHKRRSLDFSEGNVRLGPSRFVGFLRIVCTERHDLERVNMQFEAVSRDDERLPFWLLHQVGFGCGGRTCRNGHLYVMVCALPLIQMKDKRVIVFGLFIAVTTTLSLETARNECSAPSSPVCDAIGEAIRS